MQPMRPRTALAAAALGVLLAVATSAIAASSRDSRSSAATVNVTEREFVLVPRPKRVKPGRVTFVVRNAGKLPHEFVVLRTTREARALPVRRAKAREIGKLGEIPPFAARKTRRLTLRLKAGKYVLICNVPGHYRAGQFASFRVG